MNDNLDHNYDIVGAIKLLQDNVQLLQDNVRQIERLAIQVPLLRKSIEMLADRMLTTIEAGARVDKLK